MRSLAVYLVTGILVVLATALIAPPVELGFSVGAEPVAEPGALLQSVDRTHKGDRMPVSTTVDKQPLPLKSPEVLIGCEPVFSPLSASAHANVSGRCVA